MIKAELDGLYIVVKWARFPFQLVMMALNQEAHCKVTLRHFKRTLRDCWTTREWQTCSPKSCEIGLVQRDWSGLNLNHNLTICTQIQIRATCLIPTLFYSKPWTQDCRAEPTPWPILSLETLSTWSMLVSLLAVLPIGKQSRVFDSPRQLVAWWSASSSLMLLVWLFLAPRLSPVQAF